MKIKDFIQNISDNQYNELLTTLYGSSDEILTIQKKWRNYLARILVLSLIFGRLAA